MKERDAICGRTRRQRYPSSRSSAIVPYQSALCNADQPRRSGCAVAALSRWGAGRRAGSPCLPMPGSRRTGALPRTSPRTLHPVPRL